MNTAQGEVWALRAIETMLSGGQDEESRVEMKGQWPQDHEKVAKQLGGQANAAREQPVLWIIGSDAKERRVDSAPREEVAYAGA